MSVAIIAALYGDYDRFADGWTRAIATLNRQPDQVILQRGERLDGELHRLPRLLNEAAAQAETDWIWNLNVDDLALPDGLDGIDDVTADVWLMGYLLDGDPIVPVALPNSQYLSITRNPPYPAMSCFRRSAFEAVGGFPLIGYEDWGLWRRLARADFEFASSGRVHSIYTQHPSQRSATELLTYRDPYWAEVILSDA